MKKRLCCVILACALILCMLPLHAFAGGGDGVLMYYYDAETLEALPGIFPESGFSAFSDWPFTFEQPDGTALPGVCRYWSGYDWTYFTVNVEISQVGTHKITAFPVPEGYEAAGVFELHLEEEWRFLTADNIGVENFIITEEDLANYEAGFFTKAVVVLLQSAETPVHPIAEVPSSWAADSVNAAIAAGIVPASLQSKYTQATTRAEFCALAVTLYESVYGEITERSKFADTNDVNVEKAAGLGIVNGVGDNQFGPEQKLTREQAATMLSRLANAMGKPLAEQPAAFADNASVSSWAADAVGQMQATGIMTGVGDNTFAPQADYTREQSILTMMRLFDIVK